ncbi:condensation domain-containing protein, partial [Streptomyces sp. UH6]|uniref:condensation domain-containing protein n=1 Tax=Streptomyces sp. UH6 TaxID=2748379 RepID=UPI0015D484F7
RRERAEIVGLVGDAVPLRARTGEARTFADLARQLGTTLFAALDHQDLPLTEIVELAAPGTGEELYPTVLFTVVTTPPPSLDLTSVSASVRDLPTEAVARTELYVVLVPADDGITVTFEYSTDLFTRTTIERWARTFTEFLHIAARTPERPLDTVGGARNQA